LSQLSVFKSRRVLLQDYTPPRLPHRERQLKELKRIFGPVLHENVSVKVHVHGPIGTGKTVLCRRFGRDLEAESARMGRKVKYVYINLAYTPKPYQVMTRLLDQVSFLESPRAGLSPEEMLSIAARAITQEDCGLVLTLDEVDTYINEKRDPKIFYMFSRVHELYPDKPPLISLIYVSRSLDWMEKLDKATLDTIGRVSAIKLQEYGIPELRDILNFRAGEAFQPGAVSEDIVAFIADIAIDYGGIRYALELLMEAGGQAELDLAQGVKADHVRRAHVIIPKGINGAYYPSELSLHKQLLLKGVIDLLQATTEPYIPLEDAYRAYQIVCEELGKEAEEKSFIQSYLKDLAADGYILHRSGEEGTFLGMEFPFDRLAKALETTLKQALQAPEES